MISDVRRTLRGLITKRKGGPGSGHHGHAGRPGQRGGSLPGTGGVGVAASSSFAELAHAQGVKLDEKGFPHLSDHIKFDYESVHTSIPDDKKSLRVEAGPDNEMFTFATRRDLDSRMKEVTGFGIEDFEHMYDISDDWDANVTVLQLVPFSVFNRAFMRVSVRWTDKQTGRQMGHAKRNYINGKECYNDVFRINDEAKGFGSKFYRRQMEVLKGAGYEKIALDADISIGKYAWAKKGFGYKYPARAENSRERLRTWLGKRDPQHKGSWSNEDIDMLDTPLDFATFDIGVTFRGSDIVNGDVLDDMVMHAGKAFMLDSSADSGHGDWEGQYYL